MRSELKCENRLKAALLNGPFYHDIWNEKINKNEKFIIRTWKFNFLPFNIATKAISNCDKNTIGSLVILKTLMMVWWWHIDFFTAKFAVASFPTAFYASKRNFKCDSNSKPSRLLGFKSLKFLQFLHSFRNIGRHSTCFYRDLDFFAAPFNYYQFFISLVKMNSNEEKNWYFARERERKKRWNLQRKTSKTGKLLHKTWMLYLIFSLSLRIHSCTKAR